MNLAVLFHGNLDSSGGLSLKGVLCRKHNLGENLKWPKLQKTGSAGEWQMVVLISPVTKKEHSSKENESLVLAMLCLMARPDVAH